MVDSFMESQEKKDLIGTIVTLPRKEELLKKNITHSYVRQTGSRYICVREATDGQEGLFVKVLGKISKDYMMIVCGQPFVKDDRTEMFDGVCYYGYPFPTLEDLKEVLGIIWNNRSLLQQFEEASMHINPQSKFWVNETVNHMLVMKKLQYYDAASDSLLPAADTDIAYRLTIVRR